eukprot:scaffold88877_cov24-Phaeocystis_antarctica.AAC.1
MTGRRKGPSVSYLILVSYLYAQGPVCCPDCLGGSKTKGHPCGWMAGGTAPVAGTPNNGRAAVRRAPDTPTTA